MVRSLSRPGAAPTVFDLDRVRRETFVRRVEYHPSVASTNNLALERAADPGIPLPLLVLTERQTAGRGRGTNTWWSGPGALTFSLAIDLGVAKVQPKRWPQLALAAAVAVCDALEQVVPELRLGIRWPNDVCLGRKKVCGVLPELPAGPTSRLVLGVGVNVNNAMEKAPRPLRSTATSLIDATGKPSDLTDLLVGALRRLETRIGQLSREDPSPAEEWSRRCLLRHCRVRLRMDNDEVEGRCAGIDAMGALLLHTDRGLQAFYGGTVAAVDGGG